MYAPSCTQQIRCAIQLSSIGTYWRDCAPLRKISPRLCEFIILPFDLVAFIPVIRFDDGSTIRPTTDYLHTHTAHMRRSHLGGVHMLRRNLCIHLFCCAWGEAAVSLSFTAPTSGMTDILSAAFTIYAAPQKSSA